jgi:hypothetical protein
MMKIIEIYRFLSILGSSIEPEKASAKSASTPYPPQKVNFMWFLIIRDPISSHAIGIVFSLIVYCLCMFPLFAYEQRKTK